MKLTAGFPGEEEWDVRYDFNAVTDRSFTSSTKWDFSKKRHNNEAMLHFCVADMEFKVPHEVVDAVVERAKHGIFGYTYGSSEYYSAILQWTDRRFGWTLYSDWLVDCQNVMVGCLNSIRKFSEPGDGVIIQPPVYHAFAATIRDSGREVLANPLIYRDGHYFIDFDDLERKASDPRAKVLLLCSPHNPVGRVWTKEELTRLGDICIRHKVLIVSDEIHRDFIFEGYTHTPIASISEHFANHSITLISASKTFNMAGMGVATAVIPDEQLRLIYREGIHKDFHFHRLPPLSMSAVTAAFESGEIWVDELLMYLRENISYVRRFIEDKLPVITMIETEGTYMVWLDFTRFGIPPEELGVWFGNQLKISVYEGSIFGPGGEGFIRLNLACPRVLVESCMERLYEGAIQLKEGIK